MSQDLETSVVTPAQQRRPTGGHYASSVLTLPVTLCLQPGSRFSAQILPVSNLAACQWTEARGLLVSLSPEWFWLC